MDFRGTCTLKEPVVHLGQCSVFSSSDTFSLKAKPNKKTKSKLDKKSIAINILEWRSFQIDIVPRSWFMFKAVQKERDLLLQN